MDFAGTSVIAFATVVFAGTPGPATVGCLMTASLCGLRRTVAFILGIVTGDIIYLVATIAGLATLAHRSSWAVYLGSAVGGLFLSVKGVRSVLRSRRKDNLPISGGLEALGFKEGLLLTAGNPKVMLFYFGILPRWYRTDDATVLSDLLLVALMGGILLSVNLVYAQIGHVMGRSLLTPKRARVLRGLGGFLILLIGLYVLAFSMEELTRV